MALIVLPFPISVNAIWRYVGVRAYRTKEYTDWIDEADGVYMQQPKAAKNPIKGHFTYHIVLDEKKRGRKDGDNFSKVVLDFLERVELIENDSLADAGSWSWGPTDPGMCVVSVFQKGLQPA
jgi:Holliday junction resolvase RusA-like endonuclease